MDEEDIKKSKERTDKFRKQANIIFWLVIVFMAILFGFIIVFKYVLD